jgi:hypothetical protein
MQNFFDVAPLAPSSRSRGENVVHDGNDGHEARPMPASPPTGREAQPAHARTRTRTAMAWASRTRSPTIAGQVFQGTTGPDGLIEAIIDPTAAGGSLVIDPKPPGSPPVPPPPPANPAPNPRRTLRPSRKTTSPEDTLYAWKDGSHTIGPTPAANTGTWKEFGKP